MLEQELNIERNLFFFLNGSDSPFWDNFMWAYSYKWTWIPFYLCFVAVFVYKKNWKDFLWIILCIGLVILLCDQISSGFFKPFFHRFRPTHHPGFEGLVDTVHGYRGGRYGFISSHAANAFGFAAFTMRLFRNSCFTLMILVFAVLTGYSRIYLGVHFISDVVVGSLVGALVGYLVFELWLYARKFFSKKKETPRLPVYEKKATRFLSLAYIVSLVFLFAYSYQQIIS